MDRSIKDQAFDTEGVIGTDLSSTGLSSTGLSSAGLGSTALSTSALSASALDSTTVGFQSFDNTDHQCQNVGLMGCLLYTSPSPRD